MTKVTSVEYETVEKEVERFQCDHCGVHCDDEAVITLGLVDGCPQPRARFSDTSVETKHLCPDCSDVREVVDIRERKDYLRTRWQGIADRTVSFTHKSLYIVAIGVGMFSVVAAGAIENSDGPTGLILTEVLIGLLISVLAVFLILAGLVLCGWCE